MLTEIVTEIVCLCHAPVQTKLLSLNLIVSNRLLIHKILCVDCAIQCEIHFGFDDVKKNVVQFHLK